MHNTITSTVLACIATVSFASAGNGQVLSAPPIPSASVTVVVDGTLPVDDPVLVVRRTGLKPNNVIVVRDANIPPNAFAGALHSMRMMMLRDGVRPSRNAQSRPRFTSEAAGSSIDQLVTVLGQLTGAATRTVPGFSVVKAIDIEIPLADARYLNRGLSRRTGRPVPPE